MLHTCHYTLFILFQELLGHFHHGDVSRLQSRIIAPGRGLRVYFDERGKGGFRPVLVLAEEPAADPETQTITFLRDSERVKNLAEIFINLTQQLHLTSVKQLGELHAQPEVSFPVLVIIDGGESSKLPFQPGSRRAVVIPLIPVGEYPVQEPLEALVIIHPSRIPLT